MTEVPPKYRNVVNPWQTAREIKLAVKFIERLVRGMPEGEALVLVRADEPNRVWDVQR